MQTGTSLNSSVKATVLPESGPERNSAASRLQARFFASVDISSIVFFRIAFGSIMLWEVIRYFSNNWIDRYYIQPTFHFTYYGFDWIKPWPGRGMYLHFFALGILAVWILIGFYYRVAAVLFFLGFTYVFLLDQTQYLNHFYLISLLSFLLIFVPAGREFSVDALLRPGLRSRTAPAWTLWLLCAQIGITYFYGGIAKLNSDWLHGEPMRMWLAERLDFPVIGPYFRDEWMVYLFAIGGLLLDLMIVPLLLWRRTRVIAFAAGLAFHLLNAQLFNIGIFPWFMLCATVVFFPPDLPRRAMRALARALPARSGRRTAVPGDAAQPDLVMPRRPALVVVLICVYLGVQLLMPLRHWAYPGNVSWTEEGHNFSWHMKLRDKEAAGEFTITDSGSGETSRVELRRYLTTRQRDKMLANPDMILQFCHYLAELKRREGVENAEVRASVKASLNGREPQWLIDPNVDLSKAPRNLLSASWILPLTEPLRRKDASSHGIHPDDE